MVCNKYIDVMEELNSLALYPTGFEDAIAGIIYKRDKYLFVMDSNRIVEILKEDEDMSHEEAVEYYDFNIKQAYLGVFTPLYMELVE